MKNTTYVVYTTSSGETKLWIHSSPIPTEAGVELTKEAVSIIILQFVCPDAKVIYFTRKRADLLAWLDSIKGVDIDPKTVEAFVKQINANMKKDEEKKDSDGGFWKKHGKTIGIAGGVIVGIAAIAGGIFCLSKSNNNDTASVADAEI